MKWYSHFVKAVQQFLKVVKETSTSLWFSRSNPSCPTKRRGNKRPHKNLQKFAAALPGVPETWDQACCPRTDGGTKKRGCPCRSASEHRRSQKKRTAYSFIWNSRRCKLTQWQRQMSGDLGTGWGCSYLDYGNGFLRMYICQNLSNCTLKIYVVYYASVMLI